MNTGRLQLLIVDDEEAHGEAIRRAFAASHGESDIRIASTLKEYRQCVAESPPDLALIDLNLPDGRAVEVLTAPAEDAPFPILVMTAFGTQELVVEVMKLGALDYVVKSPAAFTLMPRTVEQALREWKLLTERKASEQQVRQLSRAVEQSPAAIVITDLTGAIQYVNPKFTAITGYSPEEAIGKNPSILKSGETPPEIYKGLWDTIRDGREWRGEFHNRRKNGELFWESASISAITDKNGVITSYLAVKEDITAHKKLTEQFLRAQRVENIGRLAGGVAHDLNNILAPILMAANLMEEELSPEDHHQLVKTIQQSAQRGAEVVNQVLTFARGVEGQKSSLNPHLLVAQVENILRETLPKSISFSTSIPMDLWTVTADVPQLHQVLLNLCLNSRDAMLPGGGTLTLSAENAVIDENYAAMAQNAKPGHYLVLKVADSGRGIPTEIINKIFDPFFTTKAVGQGTGLGLSAVMGIVRAHDGFMEVESKEGRGAIFRVFIPVSAGSQREAAAAAEAAKNLRTIQADRSKGNGETILLVDDEPEILMTAKMVLIEDNYVVLTASDGVEALACYVKNAAQIKLVLTDVMMPLMSGVNLARALKQLSPDATIVAATGRMEEHQKNELNALGVESFLQKPFGKNQLLAAVREAIYRKPGLLANDPPETAVSLHSESA